MREPSVHKWATPPRYETVTERVLVEPAREISVEIPAKYETWTETIEIEPEKQVWSPTADTFGRHSVHPSDPSQTGIEVVQSVSQPALNKTVRQTRLVSFPRTEKRIIPARYETITRQVLAKPGKLYAQANAAEYAFLPVERVVRPATTQTDYFPATYQEVTRQVTRGGAPAWAEVLCDQQTTRQQVADLQRALTDAGYAIAIDGIYGPETQGAMEAYQRANSLALGYMTVETVLALGVELHPRQEGRSSTHLGKTQTTVASVQVALNKAGYTLKVDGILGPNTQAALEDYQASKNLQQGYLSAETMTALNLLRYI